MSERATGNKTPIAAALDAMIAYGVTRTETLGGSTGNPAMRHGRSTGASQIDEVTDGLFEGGGGGPSHDGIGDRPLRNRSLCPNGRSRSRATSVTPTQPVRDASTSRATATRSTELVVRIARPYTDVLP
jgi:hypothetical protein